MKTALDLVEQIPLPSYAFRIVGDEFILERISVAARARNPQIDALVGKPMVSLYSDQLQVIEDARHCAIQQSTVVRELPVRRYDRTEATQYLRLTFVPVPPEHIVLFLQDVANQEVAQTAVTESEARYRSLIASLPDGVLVRGADARILYCNDVAVAMFGAKSQAALLGEIEALAPGLQIQNDSGEPMDPADYPSRKVLATGEALPSRVLAIVGHGRLRWVRVAAQPVRSAQGMLTGSITTYSDITERVTAQGALRESSARLDLALSAAKMGVWEFEPSTDVGWWSPILDSIFKLGSRARGLGGFMDCIHAEDRPRVAAETARLLREGRDGDATEHEYRIVGDDQVTRWARIRGSLKTEGKRRYLSGTVVDITEERKLEEELRRASRLESIGRLAGGVAHDFNNLLAAMLGSLELIEAECPASVHEDLDTIRHSALRARELTRQLLAFARKQPVEWKTVDLSGLVGEVELMLRRLVGPTVEIAICSAEPTFVRADPAMLEQVLVNLVVNAKDAMPNGGRLEIRVSREAKSVSTDSTRRDTAVLEVSDSGIGMDEDTRRNAFDPFFTTKSYGTGLGLASCYGIIQQHQGSISVQSQPGTGTKIRVVLPALQLRPDEGEAPVGPSSIRSGRGLVLVVDDEASVLHTTARMVRSLGYEVISAASASEAFECAMQHRDQLEVLLCDIAMPKENGPSIASRLRRELPELKVLFMSGYVHDTVDMIVSDAHFLQKPFSRAELGSKLSELQK